MIRFRFDEEKAIAAVLYVCHRLLESRNYNSKPGFHKIFKVLYFADQKHLARYGRPISGDYYVAMEHGPVPSSIYDILKLVRGESLFGDDKEYRELFEVQGHNVHPKQQPDLDLLSESDLECLDESIKENRLLSFGTLKNKSHDTAYCKAAKDDKISFNEMAKVGGANSSMLSYIREVSENERLLDE
ncbi:MAG: hypothetical protein CVU57_20420 [Deltaproteobacteria bacterium HGW-Deltaproteobacteria-15]|jgi:uncharacterized phage-associated protein|nr:MAG: hypothetical protein CVU57_20420 [Deltaproteobacteria bacterium HGW-Deltaproteobacteria-15]